MAGGSTPPSPELLASLDRDRADFPGLATAIGTRWPDEPYLQKLLLAAERLAATRATLLGAPGGPIHRGARLEPPGPPRGRGYRDATEFLADVRLVQASLAEAGAARLAYGELQHLAWQAETFGFHLASARDAWTSRTSARNSPASR